jgi:hypothetical protein
MASPKETRNSTGELWLNLSFNLYNSKQLFFTSALDKTLFCEYDNISVHISKATNINSFQLCVLKFINFNLSEGSDKNVYTCQR